LKLHSRRWVAAAFVDSFLWLLYKLSRGINL
jgi:hypothetical protein